MATPVLKKWLSYRDVRVLACPLRLDEVSEFTAIARRIAALLSLAGGVGRELCKLGRIVSAAHGVNAGRLLALVDAVQCTRPPRRECIARSKA